LRQLVFASRRRELERKTANLGLAIDLDFYFVAEHED